MKKITYLNLLIVFIQKVCVCTSLSELFRPIVDTKCVNFKNQIEAKEHFVNSNNGRKTFSILFKNFKSFSDFHAECFEIKNFNVLSIILRPKYSYVLQNLNRNILLFNSQSKRLEIVLINIKGIGLKLNFYETEFDLKISLVFHLSSFYLYNNGFEIKECHENFTRSPFLTIFSVRFSYSIKYHEHICPKIFDKSQIELLYFEGISKTFLRMNKLGFVNCSVSQNTTFNIVNLQFYRFNLDSNLLNKHLYLNTKKLVLMGSLNKIEKSVLFQLENLELLRIELDNFFYFLSIDSVWLEYLISKEKSKLNILIENNNQYKFPDTDICLFRSFKKTIKINQYDISCTCTSIYLWTKSNSLIEKPYNCFLSINDCNFTQLFIACNKKIQKIYKKDLNEYYFKSEIISFISLMTFPLFCIMGIITNGLTIIVLGLKDESAIKIKKNKSIHLLNLMKINSIFNLIYCFIYLFHIANICILYNGIFCSAVKRTTFFQIIEKFLVEFIGNSIKTASNISIVLISKDRLDLLNGKNVTFKTYERVIQLSLILIISFVINVHSIFTIEINYIKFLFDNDYIDFPIKLTFKNIYHETFHIPIIGRNLADRNYDPIYFFLYLLKFISNDIFLFSANLIFDFILMVKLRKALNKKLKIISINKKKVNEQETFEQKITLTIILSNLVLLLLRLIELYISIFIFVNSFLKELCSKKNKICSNIYHLTDLAFLFSCSLYIVIFTILNNEFKQKLKKFYSIFRRKQKKISSININN